MKPAQPLGWRRLRPRLLPLTILSLALLLGQKCVLLAGAALSGLPVTTALGTAPAAAATPAAAKPPPIVNWDSTLPPPAICPPETTVNPGEISVLSALRSRAAALDAREAALNRKQALTDAAETRLTAQLAGLRAVEDRLNALAETANHADDARWQALVATYEAMDPQAAASIFDGLEPSVLLPVLVRMNSRKSALILADMSPDKAREATVLLAGQTSSPPAPTPALSGQ